jgi:nitrite reductase (NO-forming)
MKKLLTGILLILTCSVLLAGCTPAKNTNVADTNGTSDENIQADFEVTASHLKFTPNVIEVEAGQTVTVRITSQDEMHDFVIDELDVNSGFIGAGDSVVVEITAPADASGQEFEFYCSVSNHRALGMIGTLKVL